MEYKMPNYLLGIDVGTSGVKTLLISENGYSLSSVTHEIPMYTPRPLWAEQNPEDWWEATVNSIKSLLSKTNISPKTIMGIGLTGQMHGLVLLDKDGSVLRPCIMWNDQRTAVQCERMTDYIGFENVIRYTGNQILPGFTAPKIKWIEENEPHIYEKIAKFLLPKDYIRYKLSGEYFSEVSDASGTALFDVKNRKWSREMLEAFNVPLEWLAEIEESQIITTYVNRHASAESGLCAGTPIVGGGGDQAAQAIGSGIIREGESSATLGTSGVIFAASDSYRVHQDGILHAFCHAVPNKWHLMGVMLSAAGSFKWFKEVLGEPENEIARKKGGNPYEIFTSMAEKVPAGSEGLIFLPYLTGERTPYPDPNASGVFFGLTLRHKKQHLIRAILEGVSYGLRDSLELMLKLGLNTKEVRASGGGARSPVWLQIMSDIFKQEIKTVNSTDGAAYGAALLAAVGVGFFNNVFDACEKSIKIIEYYHPSDSKLLYDDFYSVYKGLYPALKPFFKKNTQFVQKHLEKS